MKKPNEPRLWNIHHFHHKDYASCRIIGPLTNGDVVVIEKKFYDNLKEKNEKLKAQLDIFIENQKKVKHK